MRQRARRTHAAIAAILVRKANSQNYGRVQVGIELQLAYSCIVTVLSSKKQNPRAARLFLTCYQISR